MITLHHGWLADPTYLDGGCWALFAKNGHLVAEMAQKGRNKRTRDLAIEMVVAYSEFVEREAEAT